MPFASRLRGHRDTVEALGALLLNRLFVLTSSLLLFVLFLQEATEARAAELVFIFTAVNVATFCIFGSWRGYVLSRHNPRTAHVWLFELRAGLILACLAVSAALAGLLGDGAILLITAYKLADYVDDYVSLGLLVGSPARRLVKLVALRIVLFAALAGLLWQASIASWQGVAQAFVAASLAADSLVLGLGQLETMRWRLGRAVRRLRHRFAQEWRLRSSLFLGIVMGNLIVAGYFLAHNIVLLAYKSADAETFIRFSILMQVCGVAGVLLNELLQPFSRRLSQIFSRAGVGLYCAVSLGLGVAIGGLGWALMRELVLVPLPSFRFLEELRLLLADFAPVVVLVLAARVAGQLVLRGAYGPQWTGIRPPVLGLLPSVALLAVVLLTWLWSGRAGVDLGDLGTAQALTYAAFFCGVISVGLTLRRWRLFPA